MFRSLLDISHIHSRYIIAAITNPNRPRVHRAARVKLDVDDWSRKCNGGIFWPSWNQDDELKLASYISSLKFRNPADRGARSPIRWSIHPTYGMLNAPNAPQCHDGPLAEACLTKSWFVDASPKDTSRFSIRWRGKGKDVLVPTNVAADTNATWERRAARECAAEQGAAGPTLDLKAQYADSGHRTITFEGRAHYIHSPFWHAYEKCVKRW